MSDLAQAAAADDTGHGAVAHDGGGRNGDVGYQAGHALRHHHLGDDLQRCSAHALGGLDDAGVDLAYAGLDQTGDEREGRNDQRHDGSYGADGCAHDQTGQRDDDNHQDQERHTAQQVDQAVQQRHDPLGQRADAVGFAGDQQHAQRQADDQRQQGGNNCGPDSLPGFSGSRLAAALASSNRWR